MIKGLVYLDNFITNQEEQKLIKFITKQTWNQSIKRRTQHYGYVYSYDIKNKLIKAQDIPQQIKNLKNNIQIYIDNRHQIKYSFDQLIINQYLPGQGISPHIDNQHLFSDIIVSISLGSPVMMVFKNNDKQHKQIVLKRRSMLLIQQQARNEWKHSIPARKKDNGLLRGTRYSLTFRKIKQNFIQN